MSASDQAKRIAFLARESLEDWTRRFFRERGMTEPNEAEMARLIKLNEIDERGGHQ